MDHLTYQAHIKEYERLAHFKLSIEQRHGREAVAQLIDDLGFYTVALPFESKWREWERLLEIIELTLDGEAEIEKGA